MGTDVTRTYGCWNKLSQCHKKCANLLYLMALTKEISILCNCIFNRNFYFNQLKKQDC